MLVNEYKENVDLVISKTGNIYGEQRLCIKEVTLVPQSYQGSCRYDVRRKANSNIDIISYYKSLVCKQISEVITDEIIFIVDEERGYVKGSITLNIGEKEKQIVNLKSKLENRASVYKKVEVNLKSKLKKAVDEKEKILNRYNFASLELEKSKRNLAMAVDEIDEIKNKPFRNLYNYLKHYFTLPTK